MPPWHADAPDRHVLQRAKADGRGESDARALGRGRRSRRRSDGAEASHRRLPRAGASARPTRSSRWRRTTPFRRAGRSSTSTSTSRPTSPRRSGSRRSRRVRAIARSCITSSSIYEAPPDGPRVPPAIQPNREDSRIESRESAGQSAAAQHWIPDSPAGHVCAGHGRAGVSRRHRAATGAGRRASPAGALHRQRHGGHRSQQGRSDLREGAASRGDARGAVHQRAVHDSAGRRGSSRSRPT